MLRKETVKPGTLDLIKRLMEDQQFNSFYLVGGTALSLRMGHRESIDIDLFTSSDFKGDEVAKYLEDRYGAVVKQGRLNYVSGNIAGVDFDFIAHKYPSIKQIDIIEGIRMMSNEDIAAMKINAIVNSGQRVKDFIDIHYLFKEMTLDEIMNHYLAKYPNVDCNVARSSLLYHKDIDFTVPVLLMDRKLIWKDVERGILNAVYDYDILQENRKNYRELKEIKKKRDGGRDMGMGL